MAGGSCLLLLLFLVLLFDPANFGKTSAFALLKLRQNPPQTSDKLRPNGGEETTKFRRSFVETSSFAGPQIYLYR